MFHQLYNYQMIDYLCNILKEQLEMGSLKVFDSINEFCREYALPVLHPLIGVYDMEQVNKVFNRGGVLFQLLYNNLERLLWEYPALWP